ncbi:MAG: hypothetical protein MI749_22655, partial [Desulfovibrionales bacterium]|nr:hypothetical protein [Desulfovibrionales bacterium]
MIKPSQGNQTLRQGMVALLESRTMGIRELSQALGIREKEIPQHLACVEKSLKARGKRLCFEPCVCLDCGFEFKDR